MQQKAFGQFPALGGGYQFIDVFTIEAIGQSLEPQAATIFCVGETRYYNVEIPQAQLDKAGEPDAANWCLTLIGIITRKAGASTSTVHERDVEDGFTAPTGPALFGGDPQLPL